MSESRRNGFVRLGANAVIQHQTPGTLSRFSALGQSPGFQSFGLGYLFFTHVNLYMLTPKKDVTIAIGWGNLYHMNRRSAD